MKTLKPFTIPAALCVLMILHINGSTYAGNLALFMFWAVSVLMLLSLIVKSAPQPPLAPKVVRYISRAILIAAWVIAIADGWFVTAAVSIAAYALFIARRIEMAAQ